MGFDHSQRIICSKYNKDRLKEDVREEYLKHHPEMKDVKLSENFLVTKLIDYYLGDR